MKTSKPLFKLIDDIVMHIEQYEEQMQFDLELYRMHEGQIRPKVEESLRRELISVAAYNRCVQRIPSINLPKKVTGKLSKVYSEAPLRYSEKNQDLIETYSNVLNLNARMNQANRMSNLNKRCAIEIYQQDGTQKCRVLNAHQFLVFSDNKISPEVPTVFIKRMGSEQKHIETIVKEDGTRLRSKSDEIRTVQIYILYSDTEILVIDSDGALRDDKAAEFGLSRRNPFGVIPFCYVNKSESELLPYPNQTAYDMGILIPKLLTDLNYSAQFNSHSIVYTINTDINGAEINPDAVINLGDTDEDGGKPEIGTIDPQTDINGILKLIEFELGAYMTTEGLKTGGIGRIDGDSSTSGISKMIDESDATEARKQQTELFRQVEKDFWYRFSVMQDVWSKNGVVTEKQTFDPKFISSYSVKFADIKPMETEKEKIDKMKVARDMKIITKKRAIKQLYPNLTDAQLDEWVQELEEEGKKEKEEMLSMGLTPSFMALDRQQQGVSDDKLNQGDDGTEANKNNNDSE